jgi:2-polyprenyl-3-methyl-5-hydroxy-6-metoxy-1,4-benzoquinol methylase
MQRPAGDVEIWDKWNSTYRLGTLDSASEIRMRETLAVLADLKIRGAKILEVGCGTGWLSNGLSAFGKVTACDIGSKIIEIAQTKYPQVDFLSGDIHDLDLPVNSFDVVVTSQVLAHVADQPAFVHRLAQLLKPGGLLLLDAQNKFVFERTAGIDPPDGWIRKWVDMKELKNLVREDFLIRRATTLVPEGHLGILRIINSARVNRYSSAVFGAERVKRLKERAGFGQSLFLVAVKR